MKLKGIALPVNAVIIIALAVMVLLLIAGFFGSGAVQMSSAEIEKAWTQGCDALRARNCNADQVTQITTVDVTGDNIADNLLIVCRVKFKDDKVTEYWCRNKCCNTIITEGTDCKENIDCQFGIGRSDWICEDSLVPPPTKACCPNGKEWNNTAGQCQ